MLDTSQMFFSQTSQLCTLGYNPVLQMRRLRLREASEWRFQTDCKCKVGHENSVEERNEGGRDVVTDTRLSGRQKKSDWRAGTRHEEACPGSSLGCTITQLSEVLFLSVPQCPSVKWGMWCRWFLTVFSAINQNQKIFLIQTYEVKMLWYVASWILMSLYQQCEVEKL